MKRKLAALNANLSLSDIIFQEILDYQRRLNAELERRRSNFYGKIESAMDRPLAVAVGSGPNSGGLSTVDASSPPVATMAFAASEIVLPSPIPEKFSDFDVDIGESASLDDLLLAGLMAHNREDYERAGKVYSDILAREPPREIAAVVHKHRGMAYFSQSRYAEAIEDFSASLRLDPSCYKAAYYRGVVQSVLQDYDRAIEDFDLALSIHPYHFYSRYRRGMAWWHVGDYVQALADSEAALKLEPENEAVLRLKTLALEKLKM